MAALLQSCAWLSQGGEAPSPLRPWRDYRTIMWVGDSASKDPSRYPLFLQRLREMGINTAMVYGDGDTQPVLDNRFPYYVENLVNRGLCLKYNSKVQDWDKFVTGWAKNGRPDSALVRDYCLDDPHWRDWAKQQVQQIVGKNQSHEPLAYNLRDELSTTISANPFDYDFSPIALAGFRDWLRTQYPDLAVLNAEWETRFDAWDQVKPFTTDQIKNRMASGDALPRGRPDWQAVQGLKFDPATAARSPTHWNFAPWADFRTYMDRSLAQALDALRQAAHQVDPRTPVGIEGTQMPDAFGGYDLWRLARVLDWVEPYDIGNSREILGSFMPDKPVITTVFESETNHARRRLWHLLLEGDRGCIVWWSEDYIDWKSPDYSLTPKATALAPVLKEMTSPLAQLFLRAERVRDTIYLHYSQPSIQADWLLESTVDGSTWLRRFSSYEPDHNHQVRVRNAWLKALQDLGYSPRFIAADQIESGELRKAGPGLLVLPSSWALSDKEAGEISAFVGDASSSGALHELLADGAPGLFDAHAKLRRTPAFKSPFAPALFGAVALGSLEGSFTGEVTAYEADRLRTPPSLELAAWIGRQLKALPQEVVLPTDARVRVHRFRVHHGRLLAFERNIDYHMSEELRQAGGNEALEKPVEIEAVLPHAQHVYDLRTEKSLGQIDRIRFTLDPWEPSLFALSTTPLAAESILRTLAAE